MRINLGESQHGLLVACACVEAIPVFGFPGLGVGMFFGFLNRAKSFFLTGDLHPLAATRAVHARLANLRQNHPEVQIIEYLAQANENLDRVWIAFVGDPDE